MADRRRTPLGRPLHLAGEPRLQLGEPRRRRRRCRRAPCRRAAPSAAARPRRAAACRRARSRSASSASARSTIARARTISRLRGVLLERPVERELARRCGLGAQLAVQVAQRQVAEVERPLARQGEVRRERGVAGDAAERPAALAEREQRALHVVRRPWRSPDRRASRRAPARRRRSAAPGRGTPRLPSGAAIAIRVIVAGAATPRAGDTTRRAARAARACSSSHPATSSGPSDLARRARSPGRRPPARRPTASRRAARAAPGTAACRTACCTASRSHCPSCEVGGPELERYVAAQLGELPVADHAGEVVAQRVAGLARHLVDPVDQLVERAELPDPLRRRLLPHAGDRRQVVARVAAQRREVGVLRRRQAVLLLDLLGREPGHVADARAGSSGR